MPHITFVHGISNKPPKVALLHEWEEAFKTGELYLRARGITTSMVYWADVMYEKPEETDEAYESAGEAFPEADDGPELPPVATMSAEEQKFVVQLAAKLGIAATLAEVATIGSNPDSGVLQPPDEMTKARYEAIPLPWAIKRRLMERLLIDVHHYLFNKTHSPRPGEIYQVKDHIRKLFIEQLKVDSAANRSGRHIVVSHSMGTVIAYDCLKNLPLDIRIDSLMTVGSPLGISEIYDNLKPGYSRKDGFPSQTLDGDWVNVYDRLDPVAFDSRLANDYQKNGTEVILDQRVSNGGRWRHTATKYFGQDSLCRHLERLLDL